MLNQRLLSALLVGGLCVGAPAPLSAQSLWATSTRVSTSNAGDTRSAALKWELGYLALSAIDTAQTIQCLNQGLCVEGNPIFGKNPNAKKLILAKVGLGAMHFAIFNELNHRNPKSALRLAQVSCAMQGGVAMLNARFSFK